MDRQRIHWDVGWTLVCLALALTTVQHVLATRKTANEETSLSIPRPEVSRVHTEVLGLNRHLPQSAGRTRYKCKPGCYLQDNMCVCPEDPTKIPGQPSVSLVCKDGCQLKGNRCVCISPGIPGRRCPAGCKKMRNGKCKCISTPGSDQGGEIYTCGPGCTLQNKLCVCEKPATETPGTVKVEYLCKQGCSLVNGQCLCIIAAMPGQGSNQGIYVCPEGCELQGRQCKCVYDIEVVPEVPSQQVKQYCDPGWELVNGMCVRRFPATPSIQPPSPPIYICPSGCTSLGNGWCQCRFPAQLASGPGQVPTYICQDNCRLEGQWCICQSAIAPPTPPPTSSVCPTGCSSANGMCNCLYPALQIQPPPGSGLPITYVCPTTCELQGQQCLCPFNPSSNTGGLVPYPPTLMCPAGCTLVGKQCSCLYPGVQVNRPGQPPQYACPNDCAIQGSQCLCVRDPYNGAGPGPAPGKHYVCPSDCTLQNGMCTCLYPAPKNKVQPGYKVNPAYVCPNGCTLESQGRECECITPAVQVGDVPDSSTPKYICPAVTCSLQNAMCSCVYPIAWVTPPPGIGKNPYKICPPGCGQQASYCLCVSPAKRLPGAGGRPPTHNVCGQNCVPVTNGMCECRVPAQTVTVPNNINPQYICPSKCSVQGQQCLCIIPSTPVPDTPQNPPVQQYVCPSADCTMEDSQCSCPYRAVWVPGGNPPYACPANCNLNGQNCWCTSPGIQVPPGNKPPSGVCPVGCTLQQDGMCLCIVPGTEVTGPEGSHYTCPVQCQLQGTECYCLQPPGGGNVPAPKRQACPMGCVLTNGMCTCIYPAVEVQGPGGTNQGYTCPNGCTLDGVECTCIIPPVNVPDGPQGSQGPQRYVCPAASCTLMNGMCSCLYPATTVTPPPGSGKQPYYTCPANCLLDGKTCICSEPLVPVPIGSSGVCDQGCSLQPDGMCLCIVPGTQVQGPYGPQYVCSTGCQLQGTNCLCFKNPKSGGGGGNSPCPPGCTVGNGVCTCIQQPHKRPDGVYECPDPSKCTLSYHSCICTYPINQPDCAPPTQNQLMEWCKPFMRPQVCPPNPNTCPVCPPPLNPGQLIELCHGLIPPATCPSISSNQIHTAYACEKEEVHLECRKDESIEIQSVFWGRKGDWKCHSSGKKPDCWDQNGKALIYVVSKCEWLSECHFMAYSGKKELGDPCRGTHKFLRVDYKCNPITSAIKKDTKCWKKKMRLKCPSGTIIRIQYGVAGRDNADTCVKEDLRKINCRRPDSTKVFIDHCQNRNECHPTSEYCTTNCGEGPNSYLSVSYYCVPSNKIYWGKGPLSAEQISKYKSRGQLLDGNGGQNVEWIGPDQDDTDASYSN